MSIVNIPIVIIGTNPKLFKYQGTKAKKKFIKDKKTKVVYIYQRLLTYFSLISIM